MCEYWRPACARLLLSSSSVKRPLDRFPNAFAARSLSPMAPKLRPRYSGTDHDLAEVLKVHFNRPNDVKYEVEADNKPNTQALVRHGPMLADLRRLHRGMSFTTTQMQTALAMVVAAKHWDMTQPQITDFKKKVDKRIRRMCRHAAQALLRPKSHRWIKDVKWSDSEATTVLPSVIQVEDSHSQGEDNSTIAQVGVDNSIVAHDNNNACSTKGCDGTDFFVGYVGEEVRSAWRLRPGQPIRDREYTEDIFVPDGSGNLDSVRARWPDKYEADITELTVEMWNAMEAERKKPRGRGRRSEPHWQGGARLPRHA